MLSYSGEKGDTSTYSPVYSSGMKLDPRTQESAWESSSFRPKVPADGRSIRAGSNALCRDACTCLLAIIE